MYSLINEACHLEAFLKPAIGTFQSLKIPIARNIHEQNARQYDICIIPRD